MKLFDPAKLDKKAVSAFMIHIFTSTGAALALLAMIEAAKANWAGMFFWLGVALLVDGADGPLARKFELSTALPRWSGDTLDLVIDFVTYVFVPAYAVAMGGFFPEWLGLLLAFVILMTSAIYFADNKMKTPDNYFSGFPAIWNAAVFYLFLVAPSAWLGTLYIAALAVMTFLPIPFIHPLRVVHLRRFHLALMSLWGILAMIAIGQHMAPGGFVTGALCLIGVYIIGGGITRGWKDARAVVV